MPKLLPVRLSLVAVLTIAAVAQTSSKRPLNHRDYASWRTIQTPTLSRDGKFLAYALFPEEGDGQLVVRDLATGKEVRENAGTVPPAPDNTNFEVPAAEQAASRSLRMSFTHDSRFLVSTAFPPKAETDEAKKARKRPDQMPRGSMLIVDLAKMSISRIPDVASFEVPENGESFVAYLKGPKPGERGAETETETHGDADQRRGGGGAAGGGRGARTKYGSSLVLRDLRSSGERTFEDAAEYSISKDGKTLLYAVSSKKEETNGIYEVTPGVDGPAAALLAGKGRYSKITWDFAQNHYAFLTDRADPAGKPPVYEAYLGDRTSAAPVAMVASSGRLHDGFMIAERGPVSFSRDGSRLYVSCAPKASIAAEQEPPPPANEKLPSDDKVVADLWHWKDDFVQPMQKIRAAQERRRTYRAAFDLKTKALVQLSDPEMAGLTPADSGAMALGTDDRPYRRMVDYDGNYSDLYIVDESTGSRRKVLQQFRGGGGRGGGNARLSPDGRHILAFKDNNWWSVNSSTGQTANLTAKLGANFYNEDNDSPEAAGSYGAAGWTKDSKWALLYDRYDVWAVSPDGGASRKLTSGRGSDLQFRVVDLERNNDEEEPGIDPAKPMLLRAENLESRDSGFYSLARMDSGQPKRLLMGPRNYRALAKAKDADVLLVTATTFHDQPDLHVTDSTFRQMKKVTDANPEQAHILWGSGELISYRNSDGVPLQAALYKPENFDPSKKYPMMIYIYERLSQSVHNFVPPRPGTSINISYYVSNGYLVLTPDIIYTIGHPGQSALKCVLPAIQTVVDKGFVNRDAIGIQGHSWGGYQTAYLLTQTNLFRAAEAGAPVGDMFSAYNGIRWGTGNPRQFQYEKTQSRIGGTPWEYPLLFIENSPIFMANRITTPLLMIHDDGDTAVPWYQGIEMFLSLRRLGKEAYLFDYNGEAHGLTKRPNQKDYTVRMQQFFDHFLKGAPAPDWMVHGIPYVDRDREKEKFDSIYDPTGTEKK